MQGFTSVRANRERTASATLIPRRAYGQHNSWIQRYAVDNIVRNDHNTGSVGPHLRRSSYFARKGILTSCSFLLNPFPFFFWGGSGRGCCRCNYWANRMKGTIGTLRNLYFNNWGEQPTRRVSASDAGQKRATRRIMFLTQEYPDRKIGRDLYRKTSHTHKSQYN